MTLEELEQQAKELNENIEAFKRQLEATKPKEKQYTWEESFQQKGYWCMKNSELTFDIDLDTVESNVSIATTAKVIKSHLAACQLSHIIEAINNDYQMDKEVSVKVTNENILEVWGEYEWPLPKLNSVEAAEKLIETNKPLLLQYFGVEEK
jgi:hypothetical protein